MLIQVIILLICHLVNSRSINENINDSVNSHFWKASPFQYICELSPYSDERPFFQPNDLERSNIIDGEPGIKLHLIIRLINARTCEPLRGVSVHIWHANARGQYSDSKSFHRKSDLQYNSKNEPMSLSGLDTKENNDLSRVHHSRAHNVMDIRTKLTPEFKNSLNHPSNRENPESSFKLNLKKTNALRHMSPSFLRGYQISNFAGEVTFTTIMPGWFKDRTQHIHIEIHPDKSTAKPIYIGQLFFDTPAYTYYLPDWREYFMKNGEKRLRNNEDYIFRNFEGERTTIKLEEVGNNLQGIITLGVDPEMTKMSDEF